MNILGSKGQPARKADNLTAICDPIVYKFVRRPEEDPGTNVRRIAAGILLWRILHEPSLLAGASSHSH
jgi:hypothetical protein